MKRPRKRESGFALLLVFLVAAVIAITIYSEIPRVAFQTQRQKEQLLIERGEQYKIALRRFIQANNRRWPGTMDELETMNNRRFLRHRYKDPMTGKDEWRIIHIQNGVLTDSVNSKPQQDQKQQASMSNSVVAEIAGLGSQLNNTGGQNSNPAMRRRASENGGAPGTGQIQDPFATPMPGAPQTNGLPQPNQLPQPTYPNGQPIVAGQPVNPNAIGQLPPGVNGFPPQGLPVAGGQQQPFPGTPGAPVNSQTGGVSAQPNNPAVNMINQILTSPRPGGLNGVQQGNPVVGAGAATGSDPNNPTGGPGLLAGQSPYSTVGGAQGASPGNPGQLGSSLGNRAPQGATIGGGIAGVASNLDADSIMVYGEHTNYAEWEFVFDPTKWHTPPDPRGGGVGTQVNQLGNMGGQTPQQIAAQQQMGNRGIGSGGIGTGGVGIGGGNRQQQQQMGTQGINGQGGGFGQGGGPDIRPGRQ